VFHLTSYVKRLLGVNQSERDARDMIRAEAVDRAVTTRSEVASLRRQREIAVSEAQYAARMRGKTLPSHR